MYAMKAALLAIVMVLACGMPVFSAPTTDEIDQIFRTAEAAGKFSGSVLVIRAGAPLYEKSFGSANRTLRTPNTAASQFLIASVSKPFTAIAILKLFEQGKLRLDDRLESIFPELKGAAVAGVTIAQLLSHTSGMEEVVGKHLDRPLIPDDLKTAALASKPGDFQYSNSAYVVLKLVLEKISGRSYGEIIDTLIFEPAGMKNSGILRDSAPPPRLSLAYKTKGAVTPMPRIVPLEIFDGPGTIFSTTGDLYLFDKAIRDGKLLNPATQALMSSGHTPSGNWGYGWARTETGGKYSLAHQGDFNGYHAVLTRQIATHDLLIILSNLDTAPVATLQKQVLETLEQKH